MAEDSTAEEFMDFYLDDHTRTKWVSPPLLLHTPTSASCRHAGLPCLQLERVLTELEMQDTMISEHESLEVGDGRQRCQVVRWVRTFPFSFLSKREYIIGRRMWRGPDGCLFGITKVCHHPLHRVNI